MQLIFHLFRLSKQLCCITLIFILLTAEWLVFHRLSKSAPRYSLCQRQLLFCREASPLCAAAEPCQVRDEQGSSISSHPQPVQSTSQSTMLPIHLN